MEYKPQMRFTGEYILVTIIHICILQMCMLYYECAAQGSRISETERESVLTQQVERYQLRLDQDIIGQSVWVNRENGLVKAKYISYGEIDKEFDSWSIGRVVLATSGGVETGQDKYQYFSRKLPKPLGFNADLGRIVNGELDERFDAFVIVFETGGIVVSDLSKGNLNVEVLSRELDLLHSEADRLLLLDWVKKENATVFQSDLLVYNNSPRVVKSFLAHDKVRKKRRFLTLAEDSNGNLYHILFDVGLGIDLQSIALELFDYLRNDKYMNVVAMITLNAGEENPLNVYENKRIKMTYSKDRGGVGEPVNMLVYYYLP